MALAMAGVALLAARLAFGSLLFSLSFGAFGAVLGVVLLSWSLDGGMRSPWIRNAVFHLGAAWCASLSLGYNTPALAVGPLLTVLVAGSMATGSRRPRAGMALVGVGAILVAAGFYEARLDRIYREQPARHLTRRLDGVLPGGRGIRTNPNTHGFLEDLNEAIGKGVALRAQYAILPDLAGHWPAARQPNPLPIDWPQEAELRREEVLRQVLRALESQRGRTAVIVQKVGAASLPFGFVPLRSEDHVLVRYVRARFDKAGETEHFEIYL